MANAATSIPDCTMATTPDFVGRELGTSAWVVVDQPRIDQFTSCTGDRQWIHVDADRARAPQSVAMSA